MMDSENCLFDLLDFECITRIFSLLLFCVSMYVRKQVGYSHTVNMVTMSFHVQPLSKPVCLYIPILRGDHVQAVAAHHVFMFPQEIYIVMCQNFAQLECWPLILRCPVCAISITMHNKCNSVTFTQL